VQRTRTTKAASRRRLGNANCGTVGGGGSAQARVAHGLVDAEDRRSDSAGEVARVDVDRATRDEPDDDVEPARKKGRRTDGWPAQHQRLRAVVVAEADPGVAGTVVTVGR
jgi:hypothetical protein